MSEYRFNPAHAVSLPHVIEIQLPPAQIAFKFEAQAFTINQLYADPASLWTMPRIAGSNYRNLAESL